MKTLEAYIEARQTRGRYTFSKADAITVLNLAPSAFLSAAARAKRKRQIVSPKRGFYLILRPEDRNIGPSPERWIAPLMAHLRLDYRISLLRAAAFHGSSHQAAMIFQVVVPKQLKAITLQRQRVQFIFQEKNTFAQTNKIEWLTNLKTDTGVARVAGVELTLLDTARYFHKAAGINGAAQITHDLGAKADIAKLTAAAHYYESTAVRRLGYLLEHFGHHAQANALASFAARAKSIKPLDPAVKAIGMAHSSASPTIDRKWKLAINTPVEIDT
jgi:hypothetical protein